METTQAPCLETLPPEIFSYAWPDHTQLPETDGTFVKNFQEHPQSILLTTSIEPLLQQRHPDGNYCIGQDSGIYWNIEAVQTEDPVRGAEAPDWFYVPDIPPTLQGRLRRSYVLWKEFMPPFIVIEFASGDGDEERDATPYRGKFWVYERFIRPAFYAIYLVNPGTVEVYHLVDGKYESVAPNQRGHYPIPPLGVELGIWYGRYANADLPWLRWWDEQGILLPTAEERAEREKHEKERALQRVQRLAERLRALGENPDDL
ncbi:MAG: Uma2 family endonuclease [Chloroflexaceae bacterium]|nr:Uma2 family endonuclease [Chloroflexaceae bacterium]